MRLYEEFASWWPLLSPPHEYKEEAGLIYRKLADACDLRPKTLLELGSGGGSNASYLKRDLELTLVDVAPAMLDVSRALNPECEHLIGDMRTVRLGRLFDCVLITDAIVYMTSAADLLRALETAFLHCRPGGAALFAPDHVRDTFSPSTDHGGYDGDGKALRYLEWTWDPDPRDTTCVVDYAYVLREADRTARVEHDRHIEGLFSRKTWLSLLARAGFEGSRHILQHHDPEPLDQEVFVGRKPAGASAS